MNFDENFSSFSFSNGGERSILFFSGDVFSCRVLRMEGEFGKTNTPHLINIIPFFFFEKTPFPLFGVSWDHQSNGEEINIENRYTKLISKSVCTLSHFC